jgi:hypothetical protein
MQMKDEQANDTFHNPMENKAVFPKKSGIKRKAT